MRKMLGLLLLSAGFLFLAGACKSEFERTRISGNPDVILKKAFEYYEEKEYQRAQTLFDLVLNQLKGRGDAEKAYYYYAYTHYHLKQFLLAAYYFKNFSNTFINSTFREEAAYMSAYSNYQQSPSFRLDQGATEKAIEEFQLFVNMFPTSQRVQETNRLIDEMRRKLEEKAFAEGDLYYGTKQYQSALLSFDNLLRDYPESPDAERVRFLIAKSAYQLSLNSVVEKKEERFAETIVRCNDFLEKYTTSKYEREVRDIRKDAQAQLETVRRRFKTT